ALSGSSRHRRGPLSSPSKALSWGKTAENSRISAGAAVVGLDPTLRQLALQLLHHRLDQARQIVGEARRDQIAIDHAGLVQDGGAGILHVDLDVPDRRRALALEDLGAHHDPLAMADGGRGLARLMHGTHEGQRMLVHAQRIWVPATARQEYGVVVPR